MYAQIDTLLVNAGTGLLEVLADAVGDQFLAILPVVLPVVGGIAIAFFAIKVVRAILHI